MNPDLAAGLAAGLCTTLCMHPLDLVKTRFQARERGVGRSSTTNPMYRSTASALRTVFKQSSVSGLYRGVSPALVGNAMSWGLYFSLYEKIKSISPMKKNSPGLHFTSSVAAGCAVSCLTNPIWLVKTRMQVSNEYKSMPDAFRKIISHEGVSGLYKGLPAALALSSNAGLQFVVYEYLKTISETENDSWRRFLPKFLSLGAASKIFASTVTYPVQVIKTRVQQMPDKAVNYTSIVKSARYVIKNESVRGLYKGLAAHLVRAVPSSALTLTFYESFKNALLLYDDSSVE